MEETSSLLITNDAVEIGLLMLILAVIFKTASLKIHFWTDGTSLILN